MLAPSRCLTICHSTKARRRCQDRTRPSSSGGARYGLRGSPARWADRAIRDICSCQGQIVTTPDPLPDAVTRLLLLGYGAMPRLETCDAETVTQLLHLYHGGAAAISEAWIEC